MSIVCSLQRGGVDDATKNARGKQGEEGSNGNRRNKFIQVITHPSERIWYNNFGRCAVKRVFSLRRR
jgi:hypothetical protein